MFFRRGQSSGIIRIKFREGERNIVIEEEEG
jgi:hypothetical protein